MDLGGNKYRLVVHVSFAFGRVLVKYIGTHLRIRENTTESIRRPYHGEKNDRSNSLRSRLALKQIERWFESEPKPGTPADRFDLLALIIEDYERKRWPIEPPDTIDAIRYRMEMGDYTPAQP